MISYKYKLYRTRQTRHLDKMLGQCAFVWNHCLALQKRYYRMFGQYIGVGRMKAHFARHYKMSMLHSQSVQEVIERLDAAYQRFFKHLSVRPPKFRKSADFSSLVFKQGGYSLNGNELTINKIGKRYRFSFSRQYEGKIKTLRITRNHIGEFFIVMCLDIQPKSYGKTHTGASVGIDFGLKTYITMSDETKVFSPLFLKESLSELHRRSRNLSKCQKGSNNRRRKKIELARLYADITNKRNDWQWKLAHDLCRRYDTICIEDLNLTGMCRRWGRKMSDLAHSEFVQKLGYVASKYGVIVHEIDRFYPSSRLCTCGYKNNELTLKDRRWTCPECRSVHDRDTLAASNILRRGIYELGSDGKSKMYMRIGSHVSNSRISSLQGREYVKQG